MENSIYNGVLNFITVFAAEMKDVTTYLMQSDAYKMAKLLDADDPIAIRGLAECMRIVKDTQFLIA